jgi:hypothetical protein
VPVPGVPLEPVRNIKNEFLSIFARSLLYEANVVILLAQFHFQNLKNILRHSNVLQSNRISTYPCNISF